MRKFIPLTFSLVITFFCTLQAIPVDLTSCSDIAAKKLSQLGRSETFIINHSERIYDLQNEAVLFYIFELQPQGYIVTSADSDLPPVIAYSFNSSFFDGASGNVLLNLLKTDIQLRLENISSFPEELSCKEIIPGREY